MKTFKPFSIVAAVFSLLAFCAVVSSHIEESTGAKTSPVVLVVGVVALGSVAMNFSKISGKRKDLAFGVFGANIFDMSQLQIKEIVLASIMQHFGYKQNGQGEWVPQSKKSARDLPTLADEARIKRADLFQILYLTPTEGVFSFFNKAQDPAKPFFSNVVEAKPTDSKIQVIFGLTAELATGAAAADTPDILAFGTPGAGDEEVINGLVNYEINGRKELENQHFKGLFVNDDPIKNFLRFPKPIVWESGNGQELVLKLSKAYAAGVHKFAKMSLVAYELGK